MAHVIRIPHQMHLRLFPDPLGWRKLFFQRWFQTLQGQVTQRGREHASYNLAKYRYRGLN